ncbi:putative membrane protein [Cedratvirus kamchatka]|uniref:Membrane protein n=1 Tax=Cedratvirus kamchatka TaxID=2716914 RepID=A0A6G8MXN5_9VIRU|nr:putative membrane protein [Cedratvirus kamchatka]WIL04696.1 putative membrane protein [Cedratvirus duvanny]
MAFSLLAGVGIGVAVGLFFSGDESSLYANYNQEVNNDVYQNLNSECQARCESAIRGVQVVLIDTKVDGGIRFSQLCPANAACTINQSVDSAATSTLSAIAEQSSIIQNSLLSIGGSKSTQEINIEQRVKNQISQVLNSSCQANSTSIIENVLIYAKGGEIGKEGVQFLQGVEGVSGANATCSMNNTAKIALYSNLAAQTKQTSTILSWTAGILLIIGAVIVFAILGYAAISVFRSRGSSPSTTEAEPTPPSA